MVLIAAQSTSTAATITIDASNKTAGNPHFWSHTVGTGTAKLALRGDWQTHYKIGNREAGFQRVRGHGLMDNIGMYKGAGSYDFGPLDTYLNAIALAGMRPIMELDFFPSQMGTSRAPLSNYSAWNDYVKAVAKHCVDKFGMDDVKTWYWEVWNEPDYDGFWSGTDMNKYYTLYDNTVDALLSVIPDALVGGPATTMNGPIKAFLQHCKSAGKRVTFASSHNYPGGSASGTSASATTLVSDNDARIKGITDAGYSTADVKSFNTEWNSSYSGQGGGQGDAVTSMDNHWNVGFILKACKLLSDKNSGDTPPITAFSYWALSDVFDESSGVDGSYMIGKSYPFGQVFGMITVQGMRKAAFNAFKMLNYLGPDRLKSGGGTGNDGIDAMATKSTAGDSLEILVYNYYSKLNTASGSGDGVTINVSNLPSALAGKEIFVTRFLVDETHSNPYSVWVSKGKPNNPSEADWQAMRHAQHLAVVESDKKTVDSSFSATFNLVKQAGTLLILSAKRPLMGRDALVEIEGEDYDGQSGTKKNDSGDSESLGQSLSLSSSGYVYYENVDYTDDGVGSVDLRTKGSATLELHDGAQDGTLLASCPVQGSGWTTTNCKLSQSVSGLAEKLYIVSSGTVELNWLKFKTGGSVNPGTGGAGGNSGGTGGNGGGAGGTTGGNTGSGGSSTNGGAGGTSGRAGGNSGAGGTSAKGGAGGSSEGLGGSSSGAGGSESGGSSGSSNGGSSGSSGGSSGGASSGGSSGSSSGGSSGSSTVEKKSSSGGCSIATPGDPFGPLLVFGLAALVLGLGRQRSRRCR